MMLALAMFCVPEPLGRMQKIGVCPSSRRLRFDRTSKCQTPIRLVPTPTTSLVESVVMSSSADTNFQNIQSERFAESAGSHGWIVGSG